MKKLPTARPTSTQTPTTITTTTFTPPSLTFSHLCVSPFREQPSLQPSHMSLLLQTMHPSIKAEQVRHSFPERMQSVSQVQVWVLVSSVQCLSLSQAEHIFALVQARHPLRTEQLVHSFLALQYPEAQTQVLSLGSRAQWLSPSHFSQVSLLSQVRQPTRQGAQSPVVFSKNLLSQMHLPSTGASLRFQKMSQYSQVWGSVQLRQWMGQARHLSTTCTNLAMQVQTPLQSSQWSSFRHWEQLVLLQVAHPVNFAKQEVQRAPSRKNPALQVVQVWASLHTTQFYTHILHWGAASSRQQFYTQLEHWVSLTKQALQGGRQSAQVCYALTKY